MNKHWADIIPILERTEKFNDLIPQAAAVSMFYNAQVTTHLGKFGIHVASYVGCASIKAQDGHHVCHLCLDPFPSDLAKCNLMAEINSNSSMIAI